MVLFTFVNDALQLQSSLITAWPVPALDIVTVPLPVRVTGPFIRRKVKLPAALTRMVPVLLMVPKRTAVPLSPIVKLPASVTWPVGVLPSHVGVFAPVAPQRIAPPELLNVPP